MYCISGSANFINKRLLNKQKISQSGRVISFCCFVTVFSQLPQIVEAGLSSLLSQFVWAICFAWLLLMQNCYVTRSKIQFPFIIVVFISLYMVVVGLVTGTPYYTSSLYVSLLLSTFMLIIGILVAPKLSKSDVLCCGKAYVLAAFIVAVITFFTYFLGTDITGSGYIYGSKNSLAVILLTAAVILISRLGERKKKRWVSYLLIAFFIFMIAIMKCRAALVSIPIIILIALMGTSLPRKVKVLIIFSCLVFCFLLLNDRIYDIIINEILFAGRGDSLADSSSGRWDMWANFLDTMEGKWLIGDGTTFQESLILASIVKYGFIVGSVFILYALWPLYKGIRWYLKNKSEFAFLLVMISTIYFIVGIFEMLSPYGPGARCFYLWILLGILISNPNLMLEKKG